MGRVLGLAVSCLIVLVCACSDEAPNAFESGADSSGTATGTATGTGPAVDLPAESGDSGHAEAGDGDGDRGDGDGDRGDGDGDQSGDGDGDTGVPRCGNGIVEQGEQCDGAQLEGVSCSDLGYAGGTLACDPVSCTYETSGCIVGGDGDGGTTG